MVAHRFAISWRRCLIGCIAAFSLLQAGCAVTRIRAAGEMAKAAQPFQASPQAPVHRLLVVGDSTAVGTGAGASTRSMIGLVGRDHADWRIVNAGENGAKLADVARQLRQARLTGQRYDTVLVMAGGNDVIRMTAWDEIRLHLGHVAEQARALAPNVVFMPCGNIGNAPFFYPPLTWLMSARSRELHAVVRQAATRNGARYVNLYKERENDPFALQPERFNAPDKLHPSDEGYVLWRQTLLAQGGL